MGPPCGIHPKPKCIFGGCFLNFFTEEKRQEIFRAYWDCASYVQQCDHLLASIQPREVVRRRTKNENKADRKQWHYYAGKDGTEVCRHAFMSLRGISEAKLRKMLERKSEDTENFASPDMRGKSKFVIIIFY